MDLTKLLCVKSTLTIIILSFITSNTTHVHSLGVKAGSKANQKSSGSSAPRYTGSHTNTTTEDSNATSLNNLTIEVLPNDEDDESDGYLQFGLLRDAYGYGESLKTIGN